MSKTNQKQYSIWSRVVGKKAVTMRTKMRSNQTEVRDRWSKFRDLATGLAALAVPLVIAVLGNNLNVALKDSDVKIKTVELATSILREDPQKGPETPVLREWSMNVLDRYSGVPLPKAARTELQKQPILRTDLKSYTCAGGEVSVSVGSRKTIAISEVGGTCTIAIDGSESLAAECRSGKARLLYDGAATVVEIFGQCHFEID